MTSRKQRAANRRNAQKSTGPKTDHGKDRVRFNALKHGILAKTLILPGKKIHESRDEFDFLLESLIDDLKPTGTMQHILVEKIAVCYWRLSRVLREESRRIDSEIGFGLKQDDQYRANTALPRLESLTSLTRYERTLETELNRTLDRLTRLQKLNPTPCHGNETAHLTSQTTERSHSAPDPVSCSTPRPNPCHCEDFGRCNGQTPRQSQTPRGRDKQNKSRAEPFSGSARTRKEETEPPRVPSQE